MSARDRIRVLVDRYTHSGLMPAEVMVDTADLLEVLNGSESELAATLQRAVDAPMPTVDDQVRDRLMAGTDDEQFAIRAYATLLGKCTVQAAQIAILQQTVPFLDSADPSANRVRQLLHNVPVPIQISSNGSIDDEAIETINYWLTELRKALE